MWGMKGYLEFDNNHDVQDELEIRQIQGQYSMTIQLKLFRVDTRF